MKSCLHFALLVPAFLAASGCVPTAQTTLLGPARAPIANVERVQVYRTPPAKRFEKIAMIEGKSVDELRAKAASLGANGIVPNGVVDKPGPYIGVGVGGGSYSYGHHGGAGVESSASFDIPTGDSFLSAIAIHVPSAR